MRLKHSCRSNTNNLGGGCDRGFRWHFLAHAGLLFSHLPSNDLDAILTACTARRTSSISQWWREKGRETGWGGGRNKWSLKEGDDIVIHHQITGCCWTSIQRNKGDTFFSFFVFFWIYNLIVIAMTAWTSKNKNKKKTSKHLSPFQTCCQRAAEGSRQANRSMLMCQKQQRKAKQHTCKSVYWFVSHSTCYKADAKVKEPTW